MKFIRTMIDSHVMGSEDTTKTEDFRNMMAYTAMVLRDVRVVAAVCIKEGEWLAKRGGK
jgi:hypothetical protein